MNKSIFSVISLLLLLLCCSCVGPQKDVNGFTEYIIEKGNHFTNNRIARPIDLAEFNFIAIFDSSAIYNTSDTVNQLDINKLYGFTEDQLTNDHYNSARFGWRWYHSELQLFAYCYNKGTLEPETLIKKIPLNKEIYCSIKKNATSYIFNVDESTVILPRKSISPNFTGNRLYPYFGGTETAPHQIKILIKDI